MSLTGNTLQPTGVTLDIWETVRSAFTTSIGAPRPVLWSIAGIWTAILVLLQVIVGLTDPAPMGTTSPSLENPATDPDVGPGGGGPLTLVLAVVSVLAFIDIAVRWLRYLVLEEMPGRFLEGRLNRRRWSFFLRSLLISLIMALVFMVVLVPLLFSTGLATAGAFNPGAGGMFYLMIMVFAVLAFYVAFGRFGLYLTGGALGDPRMTLGASWALTTANGGRLTAAVVLIAVIATIVLSITFLIVTSILSAISLSLAIVGASIISVVGNIWAYLIYEAVLADAYVKLVPEPEAGTLIE